MQSILALSARPQRRDSLAEFGAKSMQVRYSYVPLSVYKKAADLSTRFAERTKKSGPLPNEKREAIKQTILS